MRHLMTGLLLLVAFFAQGYGWSIGSALLVALGLGVEVWFWVRPSRSKHRPGERENN